MTNNAASTIDSVISKQELTVLIFFRGHWCPFCSTHLKELNGDFRQNIEAAGGKLYAVTSEDDEGIQKARENWKIDYDILSDRNLELAKRYKVSITHGKDAHGGVEMYPDGMSQPAVIALDKTGKVVFQWIMIPSEMNMGGALDRPLASDLWSGIQKGHSSNKTKEVRYPLQILDRGHFHILS